MKYIFFNLLYVFNTLESVQEDCKYKNLKFENQTIDNISQV